MTGTPQPDAVKNLVIVIIVLAVAATIVALACGNYCTNPGDSPDTVIIREPRGLPIVWAEGAWTALPLPPPVLGEVPGEIPKNIVYHSCPNVCAEG